MSNPTHKGELALQTIALPKDTNANGDIFGGWLLSQMDLAGGVICHRESGGGRYVTVAIDSMSFIHKVHVGAIVSCYVRIIKVGNTSLKTHIEAWIPEENTGEPCKVTEGEFIYVILDDNEKPRPVYPNSAKPAM